MKAGLPYLGGFRLRDIGSTASAAAEREDRKQESGLYRFSGFRSQSTGFAASVLDAAHRLTVGARLSRFRRFRIAGPGALRRARETEPEDRKPESGLCRFSGFRSQSMGSAASAPDAAHGLTVGGEIVPVPSVPDRRPRTLRHEQATELEDRKPETGCPVSTGSERWPRLSVSADYRSPAPGVAARTGGGARAWRPGGSHS